MIRNLSDQAANERTFLAWARMAIAIMAFGFLVEKFGLFLEIARATLKSGGHAVATPHFDELAGVGLMVMGLGLMVVATVRFLKTVRKIDDHVEHAGAGTRLDVGLATLIVLLGAPAIGIFGADNDGDVEAVGCRNRRLGAKWGWPVGRGTGLGGE